MPIRVVAYYEWWSGKLAASLLAWTEVGDITPIIADKPRTQRPDHLRPYLFKEYPRQPRLGWTIPSDQDTRLKIPAPPWVAIRPWTRWAPQPEYGWTPAADYQDIGLTLPAPPWVPIRQWGKWLPQPWVGWTQAGDQDIAFRTGPGWQPVFQWRSAFSLQPWLGWVSATDLPAAPPPILGDTPPGWFILGPYLFQPYRPQPWLGQVPATDIQGCPPPALFVMILND